MTLLRKKRTSVRVMEKYPDGDLPRQVSPAPVADGIATASATCSLRLCFGSHEQPLRRPAAEWLVLASGFQSIPKAAASMQSPPGPRARRLTVCGRGWRKRGVSWLCHGSEGRGAGDRAREADQGGAGPASVPLLPARDAPAPMAPTAKGDVRVSRVQSLSPQAESAFAARLSAHAPSHLRAF